MRFFMFTVFYTRLPKCNTNDISIVPDDNILSFFFGITFRRYINATTCPMTVWRVAHSQKLNKLNYYAVLCDKIIIYHIVYLM